MGNRGGGGQFAVNPLSGRSARCTCVDIARSSSYGRPSRTPARASSETPASTWRPCSGVGTACVAPRGGPGVAAAGPRHEEVL